MLPVGRDPVQVEQPAAVTAALRCDAMVDRSPLVAVSSAQLAAQPAGHVVALRRRHHVDVPIALAVLTRR